MARQLTLTLTSTEEQELIRHRDRDPRPDVRERCAALLKIAAGRSPHWVAKHGLLKERDPDSVYAWLRWYRQGGLPALLAHRHGGARRKGVDRRAEVVETLHQGPGAAAQQEVMSSPTAPAPTRWTLRTIRASFDWLRGYTLSGVWYLLNRYKLRLRSARVQLWSPDPDYNSKLAHLLACLQRTAQHPETHAFVFLDEMGYYRWPSPAPTWALAAPAAAPVAARGGGNNQQWRIIGALNAMTGQVHYLDNYIVGRQQVIAMYQKLDHAYAQFERLYVAQDNWSIHSHPDVLAALQNWPRIEPVWLPTYAPWLNPTEKLWRWLRQDILKMHRWTTDWAECRQQVNAFLDQFADGSQELLRYVGLLGEGKLAQALLQPQITDLVC